MHVMITRDEAVALYKQATKAVTYDGLAKGSTIVRFESNGFLVQVNTFQTGRKDYFKQDRNDFIDNLFEDIYNNEQEAEWLIK